MNLNNATWENIEGRRFGHPLIFAADTRKCTFFGLPTRYSEVPAPKGANPHAVLLLQVNDASGEDKPLPISAAWERDAAEQAAKDKHFLSAMEHYGNQSILMLFFNESRQEIARFFIGFLTEFLMEHYRKEFNY
eukprot:1159821-Pelagomonas_calceolata.AAC.2